MSDRLLLPVKTVTALTCKLVRLLSNNGQYICVHYNKTVICEDSFVNIVIEVKMFRSYGKKIKLYVFCRHILQLSRSDVIKCNIKTSESSDKVFISYQMYLFLIKGRIHRAYVIHTNNACKIAY